MADLVRTPAIALDELLEEWLPGSTPQPWTWDDEELDILRRSCCCRSGLCESPKTHLRPGQYQIELERHIADNGWTMIGGGIVLGTDGRVWDGHHRIVAARRLGIWAVPLEHPGVVDVAAGIAHSRMLGAARG